MLLNNENFRAELEYTAGHDISQADEIEAKLIEQLGNNIKCNFSPEITADNGDIADIRLVIYDANSGDQLCTKYYKTDEVNTLLKK